MTNPVPGFNVTTPYGIRGKHWSCFRDVSGRGIHTGQDYAAPVGTPVVAARAGRVKHVNYGSAFGTKQVAVQCADGTEDFYAHMSSRVGNGSYVHIGDAVGKVGKEGNVTGAHLHFERHKVKDKWTCSNMSDPMQSHNYTGGDTMAQDIYDYWYGGKPTSPQVVTESYSIITKSRFDPPKAGWENRLLYVNVAPVFKSGKVCGVLRLRSVRADGDETAYHDYVIHADALIGGKFLITHTYWESGDGQASHWEAKVGGGLQSVTLDTRYAKVATVKDKG